MMDWINTGPYRDLGYRLISPQVFPHDRRATAEIQAGTIAWGKEKARECSKILDDSLIGPINPCLCGNDLGIADYFCAPHTDARRSDPLRLLGLTEHYALAGQHEGPADLDQSQPTLLRLGPGCRERSLRRYLTAVLTDRRRNCAADITVRLNLAPRNPRLDHR